LEPIWSRIDRTAAKNQVKVLRAFVNSKVTAAQLGDPSGYGYGDEGREAMERVFAAVFGAEDALVRPQLATATQALSLCLSALLEPGDLLVSVTGRPYDTLGPVIGLDDSRPGSLTRRGVAYRQVDLLPSGLDLPAIRAALQDKPKVLLYQKSCGYQWRAALSNSNLRLLTGLIREVSPQTILLVDNCYGEFVEDTEPCDEGADLAVGSLIKNPGGGLAPTGGYVVGRAELVERVADRLMAPGLGKHVGPSLGLARTILQGLLQAPRVVADALKGATFVAALYEDLGFETLPSWDEERNDLVQAIRLGSPERVEAFCRAIQSTGPLDTQARPVPSSIPGYDCEVIMAGGTFVQGSSIELSADAPLREPYCVFMQGGITWPHVVLAGIIAARELVKGNRGERTP